MTTLPAKWRPVVVDGVDVAFFRVAAVHPVCAPICHLRDCLHYFRCTHTQPETYLCVWRCVERFSEFIFKMRHNDNDDNARSQFGSVRFGSLGSQRGKGNRVVVVVVLYICFLDFRTLSESKNKFDGISPCQRNKFYWMSNALCPKLLSYFTLWTRAEAENMMYYTSRERNNVLFCYYLYK